MKKTVALLFLTATAALAAQGQEVRVITTTADVGQKMEAIQGMAPGGQPMKTGAGLIFGTVTEADANRPVSGAIVTVNLPGAQPLRVMADAQGRFGFRSMPAGGFSLTATRPGWVDGAYGRTRPGGPTLPFTLAEGERVSGVAIPMWRYATIAGTVTDESGDVLVNMPVRVLKRNTIGGQVSLKEYQSDSTDDRGTHGIGQLEPGEVAWSSCPCRSSFAPEMPIAHDAGPGVRDVVVQRLCSGCGWRARAGVVGPRIPGGIPGAGVGEDGRPLSCATTFYPNAPVSSRATVVTVSSGEERGAVDFQLRGVPTSRVSGIATGPEGAVTNLQLTMVPIDAGDAAAAIETLTGYSDGQGRFTINGVPPGQYTLRAARMPKMAMEGRMVQMISGGAGGTVTVISRPFSSEGPTPPQPNEQTLWAEMPVAVGNTDVTDVAVNMRAGIRMTGSIQFNGTAERPAPDRLGNVALILEPADPKPGVSNATGRVEASGQFATTGVPPGRYFVRMKAALPGWTLQSIMVNGRDASVVPVELESADVGGVTLNFTDRPSELSGQVSYDGPLESATVLVFPAESSAWTGYGTISRRFSLTRVDRQGNFRVTSLPAGDYLAIAIPDKMANDWQNPKFLETLVADATRVRVRDNEKVTAGLKVAR
jgi:hypothetical protein